MTKSLLSTFLLLVMIICGLFFEIQNVKSDSKTITVPDDYPTIQAALGNASTGDTVFVKSGIYNSTMQSPIKIEKTLSLIGENACSVIIQAAGSFYPIGGGIAVGIEADNVAVSGFTITKSAGGIGIGASNKVIYGCRVTGNIISECDTGIFLTSDSNSVVYGNIVSGNFWGIELQLSNNSIIDQNHIFASKANGIVTAECRNVTITRNYITDSRKSAMTYPDIVSYQGGLNLQSYGPYYVSENNLTNNQGYGIQFGDNCNKAIVHHNSILQNEIGIKLKNFALYNNLGIGTENIVYSNYLTNNTQSAVVEYTFPYNISDVESAIGNGTDTVSWDNGKVGNYWSDYKEKYPNAKEIGSTGIGDIAYAIDSNNADHKPLLTVSTNPEFPAWLVLLIIFVVALIVAMIAAVSHFRLRSKRKT